MASDTSLNPLDSGTTPEVSSSLETNKEETRHTTIVPIPQDEMPDPIPGNKFAFTPKQMLDLIDPKSLANFYSIGGLNGLEKGLRTNRKTGLSSDEQFLPDDNLVKTRSAHSQSNVSTVEKPLTEKQRKQSVISLPKLLLGGQDPNHSFTDRKRVFGENKLPERKPPNLFQLAWLAYNDRVLVLLTVAAAISLGVGLYQTFGQPHPAGQAAVEWIEGVAITVAILIVVIVGAANDWQKEQQFAKLNKKKQDRDVKVIRSGKEQEISVYDVLAGDVICLEPGDMVPVDGVFIDGFNVRCDESSATGESAMVRKHSAASVFKAMKVGGDLTKLDPFILSGSKVSEGVGTFLTIAVGANSIYGKTMMSLHEGPQATPLQGKLQKLANQIAKLGSVSALLLFVTLLIKFLAQLPTNHENASAKAQQFLHILIVTITVIVVAVPEGLPLAVTLALAFATTRMLKDNNLVRYLKACETMGNATTICSDKTGTLTENVMTVVAISIGENAISSSTYVDHIDANTSIISASPSLKTILKDSIAINSTAFESSEKGNLTFTGSKTESALLTFAHTSLSMDSLDIERSNANTIFVVPFDSGRKYMSTVISTLDGFRVFAKGAAEVMLHRCSSITNADGSTSEITTEGMDNLNETINTFATHSLRTLALLYRDIPLSSIPPSQSPAEYFQTSFDTEFQNMTLLAIVGIQDPLRAGVKKSVSQCQSAGITVRMVTGDNLLTATSIAREAGILTQTGLVISGPNFRSFPHAKQLRLAPNLQVLARSSPEDKRILVKCYQELGEVVAVTGDGTNDAPALKGADVGFSMGVAGTEVAKEASDIVLMDDNFSSIVKAVMWGRAVNDAVRKFLQFQITVNIAAVILTFITAVASNTETSVLTAVQLLWVNLIMDTMGALALSTDPPSPSVLDRKPDSRSAPLINTTMWKMIIGQSVYKLVVLLVLHFAGMRIFGYHTMAQKAQLRTVVFNTFVWMQIFNMWNNRRIDNKLNILEGVTRNWLFGAVNISMAIGQILIIFIGGKALQVVRLTGAQWGISLVLGFFSIPFGMLIRLYPDKWFEPLMPKWNLPWKWKPGSKGEEMAPAEDWNSALVEVREEMIFISWIHGGRLLACNQIGKKRKASRTKLATVMAGLVAGSIGGWPGIERTFRSANSSPRRSKT
ncbi:putative calcium p-type ATPase NCA-3 [Tricladium varicosporioides]|nr:putative calcium p-type ATPase NCA-3 [Hymenoscyphus varicosporioides]